MTIDHPSPLTPPRILCLHGGGTNARIFRAQCRALSRSLAPHFRLVYADAPFLSDDPGPDVLSVYAGCGPFKRWLRWKPEQPAPSSDEEAVAAIDDALGDAMAADDIETGGMGGEWVGLLGFSQGAKVAASLMMRQQVLLAAGSPGSQQQRQQMSAAAAVEWRFAILLAGRAPLVNLLPEHVFSSPLLSRPSQIGLLGDKPGSSGHHHHHQVALDLREVATGKHILALPTVHVHGLLDEGLHLHRELYEEYCAAEGRRLVEWPGAHRVPIKTADVGVVVEAVLAVAREHGIVPYAP